MSKSSALFLTFIAAALVAGCASGATDAGGLTIAPAAGPSGAPDTTAGVPSRDDAELDCKKLTGRMQIRILEMRTYATTAQTSGLSRSMHAADKTVFGGTSAGIDPKGEHARDYAALEIVQSPAGQPGLQVVRHSANARRARYAAATGNRPALEEQGGCQDTLSNRRNMFLRTKVTVAASSPARFRVCSCGFAVMIYR